MFKKMILMLLCLAFSLGVHAAKYTNYIQVQNHTGFVVKMSFKPISGNIKLDPTLEDLTPVGDGDSAQMYGFNPEIFTQTRFTFVFQRSPDPGKFCYTTLDYSIPGVPKIMFEGRCQDMRFEKKWIGEDLTPTLVIHINKTAL